MKVLIVLLIVFGLTALLSRLLAGQWLFSFSGNLAMCIMLCVTAIGHFKFAPGMVLMLPDFLPFKRETVFWSGIAELVLALALLFPAARPVAGILLLVLFVLLLPANIHAAARHINFEKASYDGPGLSYLWFRIPLQLFFIAWVWYFSVKK